MLLEEMELDGGDARAVEDGLRGPRRAAEAAGPRDRRGRVRARSPRSASGAGRHPVHVIEKNDGVGGTWWENSIPGARVDVGNHFYRYSF